MHWSSRQSRWLQWPVPARLAVVVLLLAFFAAASAGKNQPIAVYSNLADYSLPVVQRNGQDYVDLVAVLEPLGTVSGKTEGSRWILDYDDVQGEFEQNSTKASIAGKSISLPGPFFLENDRGFVTLGSLPSILPLFLGKPVSFDAAAQRLMLGAVPIHFIAQLKSENPPSLVLEFSSPVNPRVATAPGSLQLTFHNEELAPPESSSLNFNSKVIPSAKYEEDNGTPVVTISGTVPLFAMFSNDGRTITIGPPPEAAPAQANASAGAASAISPGAPLNPGPQGFVVVVDAAHGGQQSGAMLTGQLTEANVTLAIATRLNQELQRRGLNTLMTRTEDVTLTADQRATMTNQAHPALYICIHASSEGNGVRLYTSLLPPAGANRGPFLDWTTAQAPFLSASKGTEDVLAAELKKNGIATREFEAPLRPLNNIEASAVAVEVAPSAAGVSDLSSPAYQQFVANALATGISDLRNQWRGNP
jgi:N-acetylmuramoyl-L-alanine amidase